MPLVPNLGAGCPGLGAGCTGFGGRELSFFACLHFTAR